MKMHTVGKYLKSFREKQGLSIEEVATKLFVRTDLIKAIESDNFSFFRAPALAKGLIKNYVRLIGANRDTALALFRRQIGEKQIEIRKIDKPIKSSVIQISPLHVVIGIFALVLVAFLLYLIKSYINTLSYPSLVITNPKVKSLEVHNPNFVIKGTVETGTVLQINGQNINYDKNTGAFEYKTILHEGQNVFELTLFRQYNENKKVIKKFVVIYNKNNENKEENSNSSSQNANKKGMKFTVLVKGSNSWIQVVTDDVQQAVGIKPDGYKHIFYAKDNFSIITGRPKITKVYANNKLLQWNYQGKSIKIECKLVNTSWMCNNTDIR